MAQTDELSSEPLPLPSTLWALVEQRAALTPDAPMLIDEADRTMTFGAFRDACESAAAGLLALGIGPGARVAWQLPTTAEAMVLMVALARLGTVQVPVIPILRRREVGFIVSQTGAEHLIVPGLRRNFDHVSLANEVAAETGCTVWVLDELATEPGAFGLHLPHGDPATLPPPPDDPDDPTQAPERWIYYTSGTTSDPKGARHTDASVMAGADALVESGWYTPDDVTVMPIPVTHIGGVLFVTLQLRTQCRAALVEAFDPIATPAFAARADATVISGGLAAFQAFMTAQRVNGDQPLMPRFKLAVNGGAPRPVELGAELRDVFGGRGCASGWGLTECPSPTYGAVGDTDDQLDRTEGRCSTRARVWAVDGDGNDCPPGVEGELRLSAPQLMRGYVDASLDAEAFDDRGRFRTGDLGIVEATGHVRVTGRLKDIIIRNAENISALEVENALASHPKVRDVAVIGLPDPVTGERACAIVQLAPGETSITIAELAEHCRSLGLATQKIPEQVETIDLVPRNDLGKIQKKGLRAQYGG